MTGAGVRFQGLREASFSFLLFSFLFSLLPAMRRTCAIVWTGGTSGGRTAERGARRRLRYDPAGLLTCPAWTQLTVCWLFCTSFGFGGGGELSGREVGVTWLWLRLGTGNGSQRLIRRSRVSPWKPPSYLVLPQTCLIQLGRAARPFFKCI